MQTDTPGLSLVPKLKFEHIYLGSFAKMRVDLAAQVYILHCMIVYITYCIVWSCYSIVQVMMSESVAKALPIVVGPTAERTAQLITVVD